MPMPSPKYRSGGSLKKLGTEVNGISGTFSALALVCAPTAVGSATRPDRGGRAGQHREGTCEMSAS